MIGAGFAAAGTSPAGLGAPVIPGGPATDTRGARAIDPATRLPTIDSATGAFVKTDSVAARVYLAVATSLGSAGADPTLGCQRPRKIGQRFDSEHRAFVLAALEPLVRAGAITVNTVSAVMLRPGAYSTLIDYTNNVTAKRDQVTV